MSSGLQTFVERETLLLAPYAQRSADSAGRRYPEPEQPYRGPFQRDRDRILHSAAYRRLSGKMQVFTGEMGDYHRTRLTHTHEVASIARTIARALRLNEDLVEALALFHDIGHPPFGHAGEDALDACLAEVGGFSHNQHALTIAEELEDRYPEFPGLNLTREVLDGQRIRAGQAEGQGSSLLEVQVVDAADGIAYAAHDTDDAVKLGLVTLEELAEVALVRDTLNRVRRRFTDLTPRMQRRAVVHDLIDRQVGDLLQHAGNLLASANFASATEAQQAGFRIASSDELAGQQADLKEMLYQRVYRHPRLVTVRRQAQERLKQLFAHYTTHPELLPPRHFRRCEVVGVAVGVGEYLAGMTDRYCNEQYRQVFENRRG